MRHFMDGYSRENLLGSYWLWRIPDFLRRRHPSVYVDRYPDAKQRALDERQQGTDAPWRSLSQHANEIVNHAWAEFGFEGFM